MVSDGDIETDTLLRAPPSRGLSVSVATPVLAALLLIAALTAWFPARHSADGAARLSEYAELYKITTDDANTKGKAEADEVHSSEIEQVVSIPQTAYVLTCPASDASGSNTEITIVRTMGGLIASFKLNGENVILAKPSPESGMQGSTFWYSPQSLWGWPPPSTISGGTEGDGHAGRTAEGGGTYDVQVDDANHKVTLTSQPDPESTVAVAKEISCDPDRKATVIRYTMTAAKPVKVAPWEKTNLPAGALVFWHHGTSEEVFRSDDMDPAKMKTKTLDVKDDDTFYFDHAHDKVHKGGTKIIANTSTTFIAAVRDDTMLVKVFQQVPAGEVAPGEGDVAVFARPSFSSLENQGPYKEIGPDQPSVYVVCWYARPLPEGAKVEKGNKQLMDAVNAVAKLGCPEQ